MLTSNNIAFSLRNAYHFSHSRSLCAHRLTGIIDDGRQTRQQRAIEMAMVFRKRVWRQQITNRILWFKGRHNECKKFNFDFKLKFLENLEDCCWYMEYASGAQLHTSIFNSIEWQRQKTLYQKNSRTLCGENHFWNIILFWFILFRENSIESPPFQRLNDYEKWLWCTEKLCLKLQTHLLSSL